MDIGERYKQNLRALGELGSEINDLIEENNLLKKEHSKLQDTISALRITLGKVSPKEPWELAGETNEKA